MAVEPIKIPQNVYVEDRLVGPLTLKQVLIVGAGGGFSYILYAMLTQSYGALSLPLTITVWSPTAVAAIFAFLRINDVSMFRLLLLTIEKLNKPTVRTWTPRRGITVNISTGSTAKEKEPGAMPVATASTPSRIDELTTMLDIAPRHPTDQEAETAESLSPLDEPVDDVPEQQAPEPETRLPVNPSRITASPMQSGGTVSLFRDLSPHA